jgi:hypothetical protein
MLEPRGLTFVVAQGGDSVVITTESAAQTAYVLSGKMRFPLFDYFPGRRVVGRPRFRGALVLLTPSFYPAEPDSRTVGYTVPKGAKVLFVSECVASAMDAGYTLIVLLMAAALIAYPKWLPGHRRRS